MFRILSAHGLRFALMLIYLVVRTRQLSYAGIDNSSSGWRSNRPSAILYTICGENSILN